MNAAYFFRRTAFLEYDRKMVRYVLPPSTQKEIVAFDRAQVFASGAYQLSPPSPALTRKGKIAFNKRRAAAGFKSKGRAFTPTERAGLTEAIAKVQSSEPKNDTPEQKQFERMIGAKAKVAPKADPGGRTVSGIRKASAPQPVPGKSPKSLYQHRTQYVRDLHEPA